MKKTLLFIIGAIIGVLAAIAIYMFTRGDVSWEVYLDEKLIPNATLAGTTVVSLYLASGPLIKKAGTWLESVKGLFINSSNSLEAAKAEEEARLAMLDQLKRTLEQSVAENAEIKAEMESYLTKIQHVAKTTEEMIRVGFGHIDELVVKGYAAEIERMCEHEDED